MTDSSEEEKFNSEEGDGVDKGKKTPGLGINEELCQNIWGYFICKTYAKS